MALDSSDLQHRRTAAKRPTKRTSTAGTSIRRHKHKRKSEPNKAALVAALLFAAIAITLVLLANHLFVNDSADKISGILSNTRSDNPNTVSDNRVLNHWKPQLKKSAANNNPIDSIPPPPSDGDLQAEERAKKREERYQSLFRPKFDESTVGYDIHNCPFTPPEGYPKSWKTTEVLSSWNPKDVTTLPPAHRDIYQGLCVFDHQTQYATALNYRNSEKPFVIRNDPKVTSAARRWEDDPEYLHRVFGDVDEHRTERSPNNQFMWYKLRGKKATPKGYVKPANDEVEMTFGEYLEHALEKDGNALGDEDMLARANALKERRLSLINKGEPREDDPLADDTGQQDEDSEESKQKKFYYFRLNADLKSAREASPSKFIYDELTFLDPRKRKDSEFYIVDPAQQRGINCRFGMRGVTAANHFDASRNMIAIFGGERRYVLGNPSQCSKMGLYPRGHPSVRHSSLDWSNPLEWDEHPEFKEALISEVVLHAGDVLYLPTNWFHYIVNLSLNFQCNARSGTTHETSHFMEKCGF